RRLNLPGTARASFSVYNTLEEVDALFIALKKVQSMLA
ncbi:MAG: cysteine desulfurase/selenocysteine lyase, partial [Paraglaciecola sp.]